ncbi:MAG: hypothetical protein AAGG68_10980 [Bacteroidota bacterium]
MSRLQWIVVVSSLILFALLYFGFDTKPSQQKQIEASRELAIESTDVSILMRSAKDQLDAQTLSSIKIMEQQLELESADSLKIETFKQLSGAWYRSDQLAIAGHYAEEAANIEDSEESWSIAGTTYAICTQRSTEDKVREFCVNRAFKAFENAISINPDNVQHKVNLALVHLETQNPMTGIQMLRNLNQENPNNVLVLMTLARQAIRTNQLERASERLLKILSIESENKEAACLLADIYTQLQQTDKIQQYKSICQS